MAIAPEPPLPEPTPTLEAPAAVEPAAPPFAPMRSAATELAIRAGASWLIWIAVLSLVNVALTAAGSEMSFAIGLFVSQLIALVGVTIANEAHMPVLAWIAAAIGACPALAFGALWFLARQGRAWVFVLALVAYGIDLALLLGVMALAGEMDVLGVGINVWALFALFRGWSATREQAG